MTNPREYPDVIESSESGRPLRRGVKALTITVDGQPFTYGQPGWWASDDPDDKEGQFTDEDNVVRTTARREARAQHLIATAAALIKTSKQLRDEVLEEAAQACESMAQPYTCTAYDCARAIRALKEKL